MKTVNSVAYQFVQYLCERTLKVICSVTLISLTCFLCQCHLMLELLEFVTYIRRKNCNLMLLNLDLIQFKFQFNQMELFWKRC